MRPAILLSLAVPAVLVSVGADAQLPFSGIGTPVSEAYRKNFESCDKTDRFGTVQFPIKKPNGTIRWFGCKSDPSRLARLDGVAAAGGAPRAVVFVAKLAHDRDGSPSVCSGAAGPTDQCGTSLMLNPTAKHKCVIHTGSGKQCVPVNAEEVPYVVIPVAAPPGIDAREFRTRTGLDFGDYGVVIANGRTIPVIVADGGPAYKIGEGSTALLRALSSDGKPRTIAANVSYILFPGSREPLATLSPDDLASHVSAKAMSLFAAFKAAHP
jgi:hypothetical protein